MNSEIKASQVIQPYFFGDAAQKTTCLWLKNLPHLYHNKTVNLFDTKITHVEKGEMMEWVNKEGKKKSMPKWYGYAEKKERSTTRSKSFPGIALAMATQWSSFPNSLSNEGLNNASLSDTLASLISET